MQSNESLNQSQYEQVMSCLTDLAQKLKLNAVILVNSAGRILAERISKSTQMETTVLATLASGTFAASNEMIRQLGENNNVRMMLHEGEKQNVFISSITDEIFLVIVFKTEVALGMVRLYAKRTLGQLQTILNQSDLNQFEEIFDKHFEELLSEKLDQTFLGE